MATQMFANIGLGNGANDEMSYTWPIGKKSSAKTLNKIQNFYLKMCNWKFRLQKGGYFISTSI